MNFRNRNFELKEIQMLKGHTDEIFHVAWNPASGVDGSPAMISSCGADKTVRIWTQNLATNSFYCMAVLENQHTDTIRWCVWSPTGNFLVTSSSDGNIAIWENVGGNFSCVHVLEGWETVAQSVSWNASGMFLASCVPYKRIWIWKVLSSKRFEDVSGVLASVKNVKIIQWHPLKDILFSSDLDAIKVWVGNADTGLWFCVESVFDPSRRIDTVCAFAFNATSDKMVSCGGDSTIKILGSKLKRLQSGVEKTQWTHLCTLSGYHDLGISSVHWSREGIICSGSSDKAICIFAENEDDRVDGHAYKLLLKKEQAHDMDINAVQWSFTGSRCLATASKDKTIKIWKLVLSDPR